jgi:thiosulfate/3-mercaptopyruvate sulfurtransferase
VTAGGSPLVTPAWLRAHIDDPHVVVADVRWYLKDKRGIDAFDAGHIPSACFFDVDRDLAARPWTEGPGRHPLPSPNHFAKVLAEKGIGQGDIVVAYDDTGGSTAARLWWLLKYFGHDGGRVLDGGIQAWVKEGHPLDTTPPPRLPTSPMVLVPRRDMVITKERAREISETGAGLLLDARAPERFEGKSEPVDARAGHIPGAMSAPFASNLVAAGGSFRSKSDLTDHYTALGVTPDRPVVAYCGSGVTACHDILALAIVGRDALLYEGSWSEWASDPSLPAALGKV